MLKINRRQQGGYMLAEILVASVLAALLFAGFAYWFQRDTEDKLYKYYGNYMASYVNAIASYLAAQGSTPPAILTRVGTDWLKSTACGGTYAPGSELLSCDVPTNFNSPFNLPAPTVTFNYAASPRADIVFGVTRDGALARDVTPAAYLAQEINRRLETFGFQHASAFHALPNSSDITSANLRAVVDSSIQSTVFLRLDGESTMRAPILSRSSTWAMIARDDTGAENAAPRDPEASANVNDVFVRANDAWASETHDLAEEAYKLAVRSPQLMTEVASATLIPKPTCPAGFSQQIFTDPVIFTGGTSPTATRLLAGIRTPVENVSASQWRVRMYALYEGGSGWREVPHTMGRIKVQTRCN